VLAAALEEFEEFKEFKERSQEPGARSQEPGARRRWVMGQRVSNNGMCCNFGIAGVIHHLPLITDLLITFRNEMLVAPNAYSNPSASWLLTPLLELLQLLELLELLELLVFSS
jgi:hypothetical protein